MNTPTRLDHIRRWRKEHASSGKLSVTASQGDEYIEEFLVALREVEAIITPTFVREHLPPSDAIPLWADGMYLWLIGGDEETEETPRDVRIQLCEFILMAWQQGDFRPSPEFPYTFDQMIASVQAGKNPGEVHHPEFPSHQGARTAAKGAAQHASDEEAMMANGARILGEMLAPFHRECERFLRLGKQAYARGNFILAKKHFTAALEKDPMDQFPACLHLGLACLQLGEFEEAVEAFKFDRERDAVLPILLDHWCQMCQQSSPEAYVRWLRDEIGELEEDEDPLDLLETMAEDHQEEAESAILRAVIAFLRGQRQRCLDLLQAGEDSWEKTELPWLAHFWKGMAHAALLQSEPSQEAIQKALALSMPPLLLAPLRWCNARKNSFIPSLLSSAHLPSLNRHVVSPTPLAHGGTSLRDISTRPFHALERGASAPETSRMSAYDLLKRDMRGIDETRDELIERGKLLYRRGQYRKAEEFFRKAGKADALDESEAFYYLALTRLRLLDFDEAFYLFGVDAEDREGETPLSWLLAEWCAVCAASSRAAYLASIQDDMEEQDDPLEYKQELWEYDYEDHDDEAVKDLASALFAYLRGEYEQCLELLSYVFPPDAVEAPPWFVSFWGAMAQASSGNAIYAELDLEQALAADIPPLLLLPLRWLEHSQPAFYQRVVSPLFTKYDLWKHIAARNEWEQNLVVERQARAQWRIDHIEEEYPGFTRIWQELDAMRDRGKIAEGRETAECRYLVDEAGEDFVHTYTRTLWLQRASANETLPVFLVEVPPPRSPRPATYFVSSLLEQIDDPRARRHASANQKRSWLRQQLKDRHVELIIFTHLEHLTTPAGTKLLVTEFEWLRQLIVSEIRSIPLLLVSDPAMIEELCDSSESWRQVLHELPVDYQGDASL